MKLSELIKEYREKHELSQRQLGSRCELSTGYISLIEKEYNPQTGKKMVPSLSILNKLAKGMGMTLDELLNLCDDMPVTLSSETKIVDSDDNEKTPALEIEDGRDETEKALLDGFYRLNEQGQEKLMDYLGLLLMKGENLKGDYSTQVG